MTQAVCGEGEEDMEEQERGEGLVNRGKAEISRKSPHMLSPPDHICLLLSPGLSYFYFHCYDLEPVGCEEFQKSSISFLLEHYILMGST